jgi:hypothetical protein
MQLTYIPQVDSVDLKWNGAGTVEGVDYTVDYATGVVTFLSPLQTLLRATPAPADTIEAQYTTTGDLITLTTIPDTGSIVDTFNRPDSSTTLGTTSDGHATWVTTSTNNVPWGITSNAAQMFGGLGEDAQAYVESGSPGGTVQATLATLDSVTGARRAGPMFRWSDHLNYWYISCTDVAGASQLIKRVAGTKTIVGSAFTTTVGDIVTVSLSGGSVSVAVNGTTVTAVSDSFNQTATKHGMYSETGVTHFDNWSFSA